MGSAKSKASNRIINETINNTLNTTLVNQTSKQTLSSEENNRSAQFIELYTNNDRAIKALKEASELARILCKGEDLDKVDKCATQIVAQFNPPSCSSVNIKQKISQDLTSSQKLISSNAAEIESALKADLKAAYDNSQNGSASATPPLFGSANSKVDQRIRNSTLNNTINKIAMNMRSEIENFQKKNSDSSQDIKVELFPGMSEGSCNFDQDAAIKSLTNIGTQAAMGAIARAQSEVEASTKASNSQVAEAFSGGEGMGAIMMLIVLGVIGFVVYKKMSKKGGGMAGVDAALAAPPAAPVMYPVGKVVILPNGQQVFIQRFGKRMV